MTRRSLLSLSGPLVPFVLCLALAAALTAELLQPSSVGGVAVAGGAVGQTAPLPPPAVGAALPSQEAFAGIAERPLFSPTRRPYSAEVEEALPERDVDEPPRREQLQVTIVGIVTGPRTLALVRTDAGQLVPMAVGDELRGWTLSKIEPLQAIFRRDADEVAIALEYRAN